MALMSHILQAFVLLALFATYCVANEFFESNDVLTITEKSFPLAGTHVIMFFAPWCGHCKSFKPDFAKVATSLKGIVKVGAVNCDEEPNKPLCGRMEVKGFPTVKVFVDGKPPYDYPGQRNFKELHDHMLGVLPSFVKSVTVKSESAFLATTPALPRALLFTDKTVTSPLYKTLSVSYKGKLLLGEVQRSHRELLTKYEVTTFPTILVLKPNEATPVRYEGVFQARSLRAFFNSFLPESSLEVDPDAVPAIVDQSCLQQHCIDNGGLCALLITPTLNDESMSTASIRQRNRRYIDVLQQAKDARTDAVFTFGWLDGGVTGVAEWTEHALGLTPNNDGPMLVVLAPRKLRLAKMVGAYTAQGVMEFLAGVLSGREKTAPLRVTALPSLPQGDKPACVKPEKVQPQAKAKPEAHAGGEKSKESSSSTPDSTDFTTILTTANFNSLVLNSTQPWMLEFMAPWCGHCKALQPEWKKAANNLKGMVRFGIVDCTVETELASRFGVTGYPAVKFFEPTAPGRLKDVKKIGEYQQQRTAQALVQFASAMIPSGVVDLVRNDEEWMTFLNGIKSARTGTESFVPKLMLFTDKPQAGQLFKSIAHHFGKALQCVQVGPELKQIWQAFTIGEGPKFVLMTKPDFETNGLVKHASANFYPHVVQWVTNVLFEGGIPADHRAAHATPTSHAMPKTVVALRTQTDFDTECSQKLGLCVLVLLPPDSLPTAGVTQYIETLEAWAVHFATKPFNFMYLNTVEQAQFVQKLGRSEADVGLVALNPRRQRYASFVGALTTVDGQTWLEELLLGQVSTLPMPKNLVFTESVTELKTDAKSTPEAGVPEVEETCATKTTCSAPKDEL